MEKETITTICRDCSEEFTITGSEQNFYEEKGFDLPKRCKKCRDARKAANAETVKEEPKQSLDDMLREAFGA